MEKVKVRGEIINKRNKLSSKDKIRYDNLIFKKLINSEIYKKSKKIFIYISFGSEVDTRNIIEYSLADGKEIYVPKTNKLVKEMLAIRINSLSNLTADKWGILEPETINKDNIGCEFDLIIMPGVAFDNKGNRIGYGGGYYDKYISKYNGNTEYIALAYEIQIVKSIYIEEHDITVDYILTENEFKKVEK